MKKLFALLVALVLIPCCVVAETLADYDIHAMFKGLSRRDVMTLWTELETEIKYKTGQTGIYYNEYIHKAVKDYTVEELATLRQLAFMELNYMNNLVNRMDFAAENGGFFLPEAVTCDLIRLYFESDGFTVVSITKREGLKNGKEQFNVILDNADIGIVSTINGMIEYYDGELWHQDIPLY